MEYAEKEQDEDSLKLTTDAYKDEIVGGEEKEDSKQTR